MCALALIHFPRPMVRRALPPEVQRMGLGPSSGGESAPRAFTERERSHSSRGRQARVFRAAGGVG
eukprot:15452264-Alexandrium_andersonii.AAC.1